MIVVDEFRDRSYTICMKINKRLRIFNHIYRQHIHCIIVF